MKGSSCGLIWASDTALTWRYWGKPQISVTVTCLMDEISTWHLQHRKWEWYVLDHGMNMMLQITAKGSQKMVSGLWIYQTVWRSGNVSWWEVIPVEDASMEPRAYTSWEESSQFYPQLWPSASSCSWRLAAGAGTRRRGMDICVFQDYVFLVFYSKCFLWICSTELGMPSSESVSTSLWWTLIKLHACESHPS